MEDQIFGSKLKIERELRNWTRGELAQHIGSSSKTIARWERGESFPQPHFHQKLCVLFNTSPEELGLEARNLERKKQISRGQRHQTDVELTQHRHCLQAETFPVKYCFHVVSGSGLGKSALFLAPSLVSIVSERNVANVEIDCLYRVSRYLLIRKLVRDYEKLVTGYSSAIDPSLPMGGVKSDSYNLSVELEAALKYQSQSFWFTKNGIAKNAANISVKSCNIVNTISYQIQSRLIALKAYYNKLTVRTTQNDALYAFFKRKIVPFAREDGTAQMYQIARNLADIYQYAAVSSIFVPAFSSIHPQLQAGGLVNVMQNLAQTILQVLSNPAWQGVGSLLALVSIIISLLPHRTTSNGQPAKKNPQEETFYFCPTPLAA